MRYPIALLHIAPRARLYLELGLRFWMKVVRIVRFVLKLKARGGEKAIFVNPL